MNLTCFVDVCGEDIYQDISDKDNSNGWAWIPNMRAKCVHTWDTIGLCKNKWRIVSSTDLQHTQDDTKEIPFCFST